MRAHLQYVDLSPHLLRHFEVLDLAFIQDLHSHLQVLLHCVFGLVVGLQDALTSLIVLPYSTNSVHTVREEGAPITSESVEYSSSGSSNNAPELPITVAFQPL